MKVVSDLVLDDWYTEALDGIEDYSHVLVIFWMDQAGPPKTLKGQVQGREELPIVGLFAPRAPSRPNPVGVSAVALLSREKNILRVQGVDAIDGTPLLDIKPLRRPSIGWRKHASPNRANAFTKLRTTFSSGFKGRIVFWIQPNLSLQADDSLDIVASPR